MMHIVCRWEEEYTVRVDLQEKLGELEEVGLLWPKGNLGAFRM